MTRAKDLKVGNVLKFEDGLCRVVLRIGNQLAKVMNSNGETIFVSDFELEEADVISHLPQIESAMMCLKTLSDVEV